MLHGDADALGREDAGISGVAEAERSQVAAFGACGEPAPADRAPPEAAAEAARGEPPQPAAALYESGELPEAATPAGDNAADAGETRGQEQPGAAAEAADASAASRDELADTAAAEAAGDVDVGASCSHEPPDDLAAAVAAGDVDAGATCRDELAEAAAAAAAAAAAVAALAASIKASDLQGSAELATENPDAHGAHDGAAEPPPVERTAAAAAAALSAAPLATTAPATDLPGEVSEEADSDATRSPRQDSDAPALAQVLCADPSAPPADLPAPACESPREPLAAAQALEGEALPEAPAPRDRPGGTPTAATAHEEPSEQAAAPPPRADPGGASGPSGPPLSVWAPPRRSAGAPAAVQAAPGVTAERHGDPRGGAAPPARASSAEPPAAEGVRGAVGQPRGQGPWAPASGVRAARRQALEVEEWLPEPVDDVGGDVVGAFAQVDGDVVGAFAQQPVKVATGHHEAGGAADARPVGSPREAWSTGGPRMREAWGASAAVTVEEPSAIVTAEEPARAGGPSAGSDQRGRQSLAPQGGGQEAERERLEDLIRLRCVSLQQARQDYDLRARRSQELAAQLQELEARLHQFPQDSGVVISRTRSKIQERAVESGRRVMLGEDCLGRGARLLGARIAEVWRLRRSLDAVQHSIEHFATAKQLAIAPEELQETLDDKRREVSRMQCEARRQDEQFATLQSDLRSALDLMMRSHIDAVGGPAQELGPDDFLPCDVREHLCFSPHGLAVVADLFQKYKACMASSEPRPRNMMAPGERPTASFEEEAKLLRQRLLEELQQVAAVLGQESSGELLRHQTERELLRAAAWGDTDTLEELLPVVAAASAAPGDPALRSWTAWHAAAAHGQADSLHTLYEHAARERVDAGPALSQQTAAGLPPLAVACLQGYPDAVAALLSMGAPVGTPDPRGNTPLFWAAASSADTESVHRIAQILLNARASADKRNGSGQAAGIAAQAASLCDGWPRDTVTGAAAEEELAAHEPYCCIRAAGAHGEGGEGLLAQAAKRLRPPVRDSAGFLRNRRAREQAALSGPEADLGCWSEVVTDYTHAGLAQGAGASQALVLTSERLLLFGARDWALHRAAGLHELSAVLLPASSGSVLVLRCARWPDMVLDVPGRARLAAELRLALRTLQPQRDTASIVASVDAAVVPLLGASGEPLSTLAFVEADVFLLLPHSPSCLLLAGGPTLTLGFLDVQRRTQPRSPGAGVCWRWQRYLFVLKGGGRLEQRLAWCGHPGDEEAVGSWPIDAVSQIRVLDAALGDFCVVVEGRAPSPPPMTLRARSADIRTHWVEALRSLGTAVA